MIDIDKEEFLYRLDLRISAISCLLSTHEKYLCRDIQNRKSYIEMQKAIDNANEKLMESMHEIDERIKNGFDGLRLEMMGDKCENEPL